MKIADETAIRFKLTMVIATDTKQHPLGREFGARSEWKAEARRGLPSANLRVSFLPAAPWCRWNPPDNRARLCGVVLRHSQAKNAEEFVRGQRAQRNQPLMTLPVIDKLGAHGTVDLLCLHRRDRAVAWRAGPRSKAGRRGRDPMAGSPPRCRNLRPGCASSSRKPLDVYRNACRIARGELDFSEGFRAVRANSGASKSGAPASPE